jgi:AcrR family transcriptional regulator
MYANKKQESTARTRALLEQTARGLFEARGYAAVSSEEIVAQAGVTRGALYHHYDGKQGLFEAVAEAAMQRLHAHVAEAAGVARDPMDALRIGVRRFLDLATAPRLQRVLFVDAPAVMGWHRWRSMDERYGLGLLKQGVELAMATGQMRGASAQLIAHILLSALIEAALLAAHASNKAAAKHDAEEVLMKVLDGFA